MTRRLLKEFDLDTGMVVRESYRMNGRRHRDAVEGPAELRWNARTRRKVLEAYYQNGRLHREGGPALHRRDPDTGTAIEVGFYVNGVLDGGDSWPALLKSEPTRGDHVLEVYASHGVLHRANGPAYCEFSRENGRPTLERYHVNGVIHRDPKEGPAVVTYDPITREVTSQKFYLNGQEVEPPTRPMKRPGGAGQAKRNDRR